MKLLNLAVQIAGQSKDEKEYYLACVAKRNDGAIVASVNHSFSGQKVFLHHAEARVLRKCDYGSILYVARVYKDRETIANAMPCSYCQNFIRNMGVKKAYYTIDQDTFGFWYPEKDLWGIYVR
jgi:cytidine deaminase